VADAGRVVDRETYRERYEAEVHRDGVPFFPVAARKDMIAMGVVILAVLVCAAIFGPNGPHGVPDPTITDASPRPDFYFLSLFALLALLPPWTETVILLVGMSLAIVLLLALPLFASTGEKSWRRRPVAVLSSLLIVLVWRRSRRSGDVAVVARDGCWNGARHAGDVRARPLPARAAGRARRPEQAVPELSQPRRRRRSARPRARWSRDAAHRDQLIRQVLQGGATCRPTARTSPQPK